MLCTKCGMEAMMISDLWYCAFCVKLFNECTCEPKPADSSQSGYHLLSPSAYRRKGWPVPL